MNLKNAGRLVEEFVANDVPKKPSRGESHGRGIVIVAGRDRVGSRKDDLMCNTSCIEFGRRALGDVCGKTILDVGAYNYNGSLKDHLAGYAKYVGVDIRPDDRGYVDEVCDVADLVSTFGPGRFDIVISTEMPEHNGSFLAHNKREDPRWTNL